MTGGYVSKLGSYITQMVAQKRAVGYPYKESERVLYGFDRFCATGFPNTETITPEIGNAWAVIRPTEKTGSFLDRLAPVRELARYMNHAGTEAYIIPAGLAPVEAQRYIPHIFSLEELQRFFQAADSQPILPRSRLRHLQIPVIFRLMYTCGLRPHEARLIQKEHLNLPESTIFIRHTRAIHLYRGGMPLSILSEFLGHASEETTRIYAYADTEMKRKAIEKATPKAIPGNETPIWDASDDATLRRLAGLR